MCLGIAMMLLRLTLTAVRRLVSDFNHRINESRLDMLYKAVSDVDTEEFNTTTPVMITVN